MKQAIVIIGIGEMGGVFARGFLRIAHPVFPMVRGMHMDHEAKQIPPPALVLLAVAEDELHAMLSALPGAWRERLGLLQNELLPRDWEAHGLDDPTVISVWFEKKKAQGAKVILPSPVYGPHSGLFAQALATLDIPTTVLESRDRLVFELVSKNLYILTTNLCGLETGGTVGELWRDHQAFAREIGNEVLDIQQALTGQALDREALFAAMARAFGSDPGHRCLGRSAPARLARALQLAEQAGLAVPALRRLKTE
jgi:hypothetical protein